MNYCHSFAAHIWCKLWYTDNKPNSIMLLTCASFAWVATYRMGLSEKGRLQWK